MHHVVAGFSFTREYNHLFSLTQTVRVDSFDREIMIKLATVGHMGHVLRLIRKNVVVFTPAWLEKLHDRLRLDNY
jgi:hypothetical protein